ALMPWPQALADPRRCRSRASNFAVMHNTVSKVERHYLRTTVPPIDFISASKATTPSLSTSATTAAFPGANSREIFSANSVSTPSLVRSAEPPIKGAGGSSDRRRNRTNRQTRQRADESADGCAAESFFGNLLDRQLSVRVPCNNGGGIELDVSFRAQLPESADPLLQRRRIRKHDNDELAHQEPPKSRL